MNKIVTGVGSRSTPPAVLDKMYEIGTILGSADWILRSGAADGADTAFEKGFLSVGGKTEIFLPWKNFNNHSNGICPTAEEMRKSIDIVSKIHPYWNNLKIGTQKLHARNVNQVLGRNLDTPSTALICWTPDGKIVGGTATAIRLAMQYNIPVFNLFELDKFDISLLIG